VSRFFFFFFVVVVVVLEPLRWYSNRGLVLGSLYNESRSSLKFFEVFLEIEQNWYWY
jgi:hypothetical protein